MNQRRKERTTRSGASNYPKSITWHTSEEITVALWSHALRNLYVHERVHKFMAGTYPEPIEYGQKRNDLFL